MPEPTGSGVGVPPTSTDTSAGGDWHKAAVFGSVFVAVGLAIALASATAVAWSERACLECHQTVTRVASTHQETDCWRCHRSPGRLEGIGRPLRVVRMGIGWLLARDPMASRLDQGACLECHDQRMRQTVQTDGISVRHSDFLESARCQECHAEHGPTSIVPVLDKCATCHNGLDADNSCDTCHSGVVPTVESSTGWMASIHLVRDSPAHGAGSFETCPMCHDAGMCARCHEASRLPHGSGPDWQLAHGASAIADDSGCLTCHEKHQCNSCHDLPMPHPEGWLPDHPDQTLRLGSKLCYSCHATQDCDKCHIRHTHPYGFEKNPTP